MEKINLAKTQGNTAFRNGSYADAITCYEESLMQAKFRKSDIAKEMPDLSAEEAAQIEAQRSELETIHQALLNNLAMCYQKMNQINESCFYNDQCLELNPDHVKARYRKAVICAHDKEFEEALAVINALIAQDPSSDDFRVLLGTIQTQ